MAPITRRRALQAATPLLAALAGCSGSSSRTHSEPPERPDNYDLDPEYVVLRNRSLERTAWLEPDGTTTGTTDERPPPGRSNLVADPETADRLTFADVDGVEAAREFVAATDFSTETLYVERSRVGECFENRLCYVTWSASEIDTQYGRYYRDADVACTTENEDWLVHVIRIPDALRPQSVRSHGSGWSSRGCTPPRWLLEEWKAENATGTTTPASGGPGESN
ncbi:hypothetical protein ACFQH6_17855 [Halobacteriaceae archaeon GCM10025711]